MHEGIDIRAIGRDDRGEPADPVFATADGTIVHVNHRAGLSNYGIYMVLEHNISGMRVWSLYAHLKEVYGDLDVGAEVRSGERIATMGRTANTRSGISKDRAHLHFEIGFLTHLRFAEWLKKTVRGSRNDHGMFNGQNFLGIDPQILLLSSHRFADNFDLARFLAAQPELFRVAVRARPTDWIERYPMLVHDTDDLAPDSIAGYEIHFDYAGIPVRIYPRTETELPSKQRYTLISVSPEEYARNPCRRLVTRRGDQFRLGSRGTRLLDLLTF
jgi:murein DD-endopeptidase MepM/ murein hydrolase activator NlpD